MRLKNIKVGEEPYFHYKYISYFLLYQASFEIKFHKMVFGGSPRKQERPLKQTHK